MRRINGNAVAIALAAVAVAIAGTGTAVAVSATQVNIVDPTKTTQVAHVDKPGRLSVRPPSTDFTSSYWMLQGMGAFTSPTTATLALTHLDVYNTGLNAAYANTNFQLAIQQVSVGSNCYDGSLMRTVTFVRSAVGTSVSDDWSTPLTFKPNGTQPYCLALQLSGEGTNPSSYYLPFVTLAGYVVSGNYSGIGASSAPAAGASRPDPGRPPLRTPSDPHPAGTGAPTR